MAATATIPIVFASGADPVKSGLVVSLNRPSSNVTGVYFLIDALPTKNLHLLHELVPQTSTVALLVNPNNAVAVGTELPSVQAAARTLGLNLVVVKAAAERDIDAAFANVVHARAGALIIASDSFIFGHRQQIIALAARHSIPTAYPWREAPAAGGLVSYGTSLTDAYRLAGVYTGRILGGAKPADLPVQQSTKFELVINLKTAKALGLDSPADAARARRRGDRMKRREFITLLGGAAAAWPLAARAQQPSRVPKIGYLSPVSASSGFLAYEMFRQGLRELGYVDGTNIVIEYRFADGQFDRLPALAAELVQLKVDVIVTAVTQASLAARDATKTIPIVIAGVSDPVGSGLIENLARPGGNITGTSSQTSEVVGKSLELLKEVIPGIVRVAALWNPSNVVFQTKMLKEAETAAAALRIQLKVFGGRDADELGGAFTAIAHEHADALLVLADPFLISRQKNIVDFALKQRLPAIYATKEHATVGGLMTYGPNINGQFRRAAAYVDRILKGAKPSDLPVEQPTQFELAINLKTAKVLGLTIPPTLLARADEVIE